MVGVGKLAGLSQVFWWFKFMGGSEKEKEDS